MKHAERDYQHTIELIESLPERDQHELRLMAVKMLMTVQPGVMAAEKATPGVRPTLRIVKAPATGRG